MPAKDMAAYMRARRARQKAEREAEREAPSGRVFARPAIPLGRPLTPEERRDDAELDAIEGRGGTAEWTGDRWREVTPAPRPSLPAATQPAPRTTSPAPRPSTPAARPRPAASPRSSVVVCGGRPGTGRRCLVTIHRLRRMKLRPFGGKCTL
jgi:hypothetical protein